MYEVKKMGKRIAELRGSLGITQQELADRLHVTSQAISNWERGVSSPEVAKLQQIATTLGVEVEELLCINGNVSRTRVGTLSARVNTIDIGRLGKRIASYRLKNNMTQQELALVMGITVQAVSNWERGISSPDVTRLVQIAQCFGVSPQRILSDGAEGKISGDGSSVEDQILAKIIPKRVQRAGHNKKVLAGGFFRPFCFTLREKCAIINV